MKSIYKLAVLVVAGIAALVLAGTALATQKLEVSQTANAVTIKLTQAQTDQQPAKISVYVPAGYTLNTSQTPGSVLGRTVGVVFARDLGIPLPLEGDVIADNPASYVANPCAPGTHQGVWILRLAVAGQSINLPVYVDPTAGPEAALGSAKLQVCLGPSDVPQGTPGRSPNGAQLLSATFTVNGALTPPTSNARWVAFTTPYNAGVGTPNVAGTVETRAVVGPGSITLTAKVTNKKKKQVTLSGRVTQSGFGIGGTVEQTNEAGTIVRVAAAKVGLFLGVKSSGSATANATGQYSKKVRGKGKKVVFQARVTALTGAIITDGCANPTQPPIPCVSATAGGFTATSRKITVRF